MLVSNNIIHKTLIISGIILKRALQGAGLKQDQAAKMLGVSRPTLSIWCNKDALSQDIIQNVKSRLGIDLLKVLLADRSVTVTGETESVQEIIEASRNTMERARDQIRDATPDLIDSYKQTIKSKDEMIELLRDQVKDLKERLEKYEGKSKAHSA